MLNFNFEIKRQTRISSQEKCWIEKERRIKYLVTSRSWPGTRARPRHSPSEHNRPEYRHQTCLLRDRDRMSQTADGPTLSKVTQYQTSSSCKQVTATSDQLQLYLLSDLPPSHEINCDTQWRNSACFLTVSNPEQNPATREPPPKHPAKAQILEKFFPASFPPRHLLIPLEGVLPPCHGWWSMMIRPACPTTGMFLGQAGGHRPYPGNVKELQFVFGFPSRHLT